MRIERKLETNLQEQLSHYENLLNFASQKSEILKDGTGKNNVAPLRCIVQQETKVVSTLNELEQQRLSLMGTTKLDNVIAACPEQEQKTKLISLRERIKEIVVKLEEKNTRNKLMLDVSLRIIGKVLSTVQGLSAPEKMTYSRLRKQTAASRPFPAVNFKI